MKLFIKEKKGATLRAFNTESEKDFELRIFQRDVATTLITGSVIECECEILGNNVSDLVISKEYLPNHKKERLQVSESIGIGSLVDDVPVRHVGKTWVEDGKKVHYAYFR